MELRPNAKIRLLKQIPLFGKLSRPELEGIAKIADEIDFREGKELAREGAAGREFFVIVEGDAEVTRGKRKLRRLGDGDFFGEISLIAKTPRNATITTTSPVRTLVITDRAFRQLLDHAPQIQIGVLTALAERLAPTTL